MLTSLLFLFVYWKKRSQISFLLNIAKSFLYQSIICKTQKANQQTESDAIKTIFKTVDYSLQITVFLFNEYMVWVK